MPKSTLQLILNQVTTRWMTKHRPATRQWKALMLPPRVGAHHDATVVHRSVAALVTVVLRALRMARTAQRVPLAI